MRQSEQKVFQYLDKAHTSEMAQARVLQSQILMTPRGRYRSALETHLKETRGHAKRLGRRKEELGRGREPLTAIVGFASAFSQLMALGKTPLEVIRGSGGEEKVLENAKDAYASEALEIATYTALEQLARAAGDDASASLAESIRTEEEKMLERVLCEISHLTDAVARAELTGESSYELTNTGAADAIREVGESVRGSAGTVQSRARRTARKARKVPGMARAEDQVKGMVASAGDLSIPSYDKLTANEVVERLPALSQIELSKVQSYEHKRQKRSTILSRVSALQAQEPWPGYDELNAGEIRATLGEGDEGLARAVHSYERAHKDRSSVVEVAVRERERLSA